VTVERVGDVVRLTVHDNGPGLPEAIRSSLDDSDATADVDGGLSIVETLVRGYGGTLDVTDVDPRGTEFVVELPATDDEDA
jgi:signal transduction histidine kinase